MGKRKWTNIQALEAGIIAMREEGKTRREICERFSLEEKQLHNWITRHNKQQAKMARGITPRPKGRPRKDGQPPHQSELAEIKRLRMENELLRDFLRLAGRRSGQG